MSRTKKQIQISRNGIEVLSLELTGICLGIFGGPAGSCPHSAGPELSYLQQVANLKGSLAKCHRHFSPQTPFWRVRYSRPANLYQEQRPIFVDRSIFLEGPVRLELTTPCLKGRCSNQLSYGPLRQNNQIIIRFFSLKIKTEW